jgi:hypothetical protein
MTFRPPSWRPSPPVSHSTEIEHRLTVVETMQLERMRSNDKRVRQDERTIRQVLARLTLHERAILLLASAVSVLLQDKWPGLADIIRGAIK